MDLLFDEIPQIGNHPISFTELRYSLAPNALAISCAPRQIPRTGFPELMDSWINCFSEASQENLSLSFTLIGPPKITSRSISFRLGYFADSKNLVPVISYPDASSQDAMLPSPSNGMCCKQCARMYHPFFSIYIFRFSSQLRTFNKRIKDSSSMGFLTVKE